jgi:hypothetical protein
MATPFNEMRHPLPLVDPVHCFTMYTNAKCGGSSLKHWFFASASLQRVFSSPREAMSVLRAAPWSPSLRGVKRRYHHYIATRSDESVRKLTQAYRDFVSRRLLTSNGSAKFKKFIIVRNPADRIVSAFIDKLCGDDAATSWVQEVVSEGGHAGAISFDQFLRYLSRHGDEELNPHWRRQTYVIDGLHDVEFLPLERLGEEMAARREVWGDRPKLAATAKAQSNEYRPWGISPPDLRQLPSGEIVRLKEKFGSFPAKAEFLDESAIGQIKEIYQKDYRRLPYE